MADNGFPYSTHLQMAYWTVHTMASSIQRSASAAGSLELSSDFDQMAKMKQSQWTETVALQTRQKDTHQRNKINMYT